MRSNWPKTFHLKEYQWRDALGKLVSAHLVGGSYRIHRKFLRKNCKMQKFAQKLVQKSRLNLHFKILTKHCAQSLNTNLASKTRPNLRIDIFTKLQLSNPYYSYKLSSILSSASTSAILTTSTSFELASSIVKLQLQHCD